MERTVRKGERKKAVTDEGRKERDVHGEKGGEQGRPWPLGGPLWFSHSGQMILI